ncbi:MAG: hypothetical protein CTY25_01150 [Methylobacterium sp.]|nr:MAG: hypothetical protein CTY25_01150 [Methylobacterium sp.]
MKRRQHLALACFLAAVFAASELIVRPVPVVAGPIAPREGWEIRQSGKSYAALLESLRAAIAAEGMGLVTEAGPTETAKARGVTIPGNRVVGVFRNDFAVRVLGLSTAAMIEAPIRFYVTEGPDGKGWLSWKRPSFVFKPYAAEGGAGLAATASELDAIFLAIATRALAATP